MACCQVAAVTAGHCQQAPWGCAEWVRFAHRRRHGETRPDRCCFGVELCRLISCGLGLQDHCQSIALRLFLRLPLAASVPPLLAFDRPNALGSGYSSTRSVHRLLCRGRERHP
jgi:hypothetical protein